MKFENNIPIYIQLVEIIKNGIINGKYEIGSRLPSVRELSKIYQLNQNTVLKSYKILEDEEIIETKRGLGFFVVDNKKMVNKLEKIKIHQLTNNFLTEIKKLGYEKNEIIKIIEEME